MGSRGIFVSSACFDSISSNDYSVFSLHAPGNDIRLVVLKEFVVITATAIEKY